MTQSGRSRCWKLAIASSVFVGGAIAYAGNCALAQITPDSTLGTESSSVTPPAPGSPYDVINGGAKRDKNLFHSFIEFNVGNQQRVYFTNPAGVETIIGRVTGTDPSDILGTLGVNGTANLFLLNPNGIIFGPNARLDVKGSFVASTADSIVFENGFAFSATNPQASRLLTINVPLGLQFGANPGRIDNQSLEGLEVEPGMTLALVGGEIALEGGRLMTAGGRIELGSVAELGLVSLNPTDKGWTVVYEGIQNFQDIRLSQQAVVDASGEGGGDIQVQGRYVRVADGSHIQANTLGAKPGGNLAVTASEAVELIGTSADGRVRSRLTTQTEGDGSAGALTITTKRLIVQNGALISTGAFGNYYNPSSLLPPNTGAGGSLTITASDSVELIGETPDSHFQSRLTTQTRSDGSAGDLTITTGKFIVRDGGQVSAGTFPRSRGSGGNLTVTASDSVELIGASADGKEVSRLTNLTAGAGPARALTITTGKLTVQGGGLVSAGTVSRSSVPGNLSLGPGGSLNITASNSVRVIGGLADTLNRSSLTTRSEGSGKAGDLTITTGKLIVQDGAQVSAGTFYDSRGQGGNLTVNASDSVAVIGESLDGRVYSRLTNRTAGEGDAGNSTITTGKLIVRDGGQVSADTLFRGLGGSLDVIAYDLVEVTGRASDGFPSSLSAKTNNASSAGSLTIVTGTLAVQDGAQVTVSGFGSGDAGNLVVQSRELNLDNQGVLRATTESGEGGNITLREQDLILMRRNSEISTEARGTGNGGNINIDADLLVAVPSEDSDIVADASEGNGGNINITTQGIFGIEFREKRMPLSDITASSEFGVDGVVELNTPDVDPSRGLVNLPAELVDVTGLIAQGCPGERSTVAQSVSEFTITGRGGLPPKPTEPLRSDAVRVDLDAPIQSQDNRASAAVTANPTSSESIPLVEAQGWVFNDKGEVVLVAQAPTVTPYSSPSTPATCHAF